MDLEEELGRIPNPRPFQSAEDINDGNDSDCKMEHAKVKVMAYIKNSGAHKSNVS